MKIRRALVYIFSFSILFVFGACAGYPQYQPSVSLIDDKPFLSGVEAIGIVRQHSMSSEISPSEKRAAEHIRNLESGLNNAITWEAVYNGSGKWTVTLHVPVAKPENGINYRWTVFEKNLSAIFIEETKTNVNAGK